MLAQFTPIAVLAVLAVGFSLFALGAGQLLGPSRPNPTKLAAYECGNEPLADVKGTRFSVRFYMVAMMFLIFDVEALLPFFVPLLESRSEIEHVGGLVAIESRRSSASTAGRSWRASAFAPVWKP